MRILLVHNFYKLAGGEDTVFYNEKKLLEMHGNQVFTYTRSNSEIDGLSKIAKAGLFFASIYSKKTYREVKSLIQKEKIEIVHVHNTMTMISPSVFYAAFSCHVPVVQTLHNFRMECPNALFYRDGHICEDCVERNLFCAVKNRCYRNSFAQSFTSAMILKVHRLLGTYRKVNFICLTEFNKGKLLELNKIKRIIDEKKVFIKPNFVPEPKCQNQLPEKKKNQFIYAGRLSKEKGICTLLQNWQDDKKSLLICGSGPEEEWCKNIIFEKHLKNVRMLGQMPHDQLMQLIAESEALLFPSEWYEGLPMIIVESYMQKTKVYANQIGNMKELLAENVFDETEGLKEKSFYPEENYQILMSIYQQME